MTEPRHSFYLHRLPGHHHWLIVKLKSRHYANRAGCRIGWHLETDAQLEFEWDPQYGIPVTLLTFIATNRVSTEPDEWAILLDLFPERRPRIEGALTEICERHLLRAGGGPGPVSQVE